MALKINNEEEILSLIEDIFPILQDKLPSEANFYKIKLLNDLNISYCVKSLVFHFMERYIRTNVAPQFWSNFKNLKNKQLGFKTFEHAVNDLYSNMVALIPTLKVVDTLLRKCSNYNCVCNEQSILKYFKLIVRSILLSQIPLHHEVIIQSFYKIGFNVFCTNDSVYENLDNSAEKSKCAGCDYDQSNCQCQKIVHIFHETNRKLFEMELLERLVGNVLTSLIHIRIKNHIVTVCDRNFDVSRLVQLENWIQTVVMNWLIRIYSGGYSKCNTLNKKNSDSLEKFKKNLMQYLYETFTKVRIDQLFNIIIEYPDSQPTIEDLKICLNRTDLRKHLTESLKNALKTRLLHTGVNTQDILTAYVTAIKSLRQLDPTGVLLEAVTEPIRLYLRSREDTVRCVVSGLLDESPSDLADELVKGESLQTNEDVEESNENWNTWMPDPVDADPAKSSQRRVSDIISMLVNIYGSQDLFVNEYRTLLADRLLSQLNYHTEREIRHLELLKRRFGEHQLHFCEVMLKDVYDSKRIDGNIQSDPNYSTEATEFSTSALILSAQFWPPFKEEWKLELPASVQKQLDRYVKAFEALKGNRTLCWKSHLGSVNLEIELKDRKIAMNVTPVHATIILHFQDKGQWTLNELAEVMHIPTTILQRKIAFWVSHGLVKNTTEDTYVLEEEYVSKSRNLSEVIEDEEIESVMTSASDQREEELQVFWSYIVGMLTNLDSMPLERIHQMLKMFASQGSGAVECSLSELRSFLDRKVREHQLLLTSGLYRLPK